MELGGIKWRNLRLLMKLFATQSSLIWGRQAITAAGTWVESGSLHQSISLWETKCGGLQNSSALVPTNYPSSAFEGDICVSGNNPGSPFPFPRCPGVPGDTGSNQWGFYAKDVAQLLRESVQQTLNVFFPARPATANNVCEFVIWMLRELLKWGHLNPEQSLCQIQTGLTSPCLINERERRVFVGWLYDWGGGHT